ncbi:hypothetical protein [Paenibacillus sabinae]|uniref:Uncharacterized protein n=1 Tax=Paenibacillus sabinae T27 TaxID=1268072 RepID=X4ZY02_9BACL|nr:hypothetical protein [Paenibacillus sabinae]AHV97078.1 hypothetical protein PSAB_10740 [Paenibacillus sabinae T27]
MKNIEQLIQRRKQLQFVKATLNRNALLTTAEGMMYVKCLALLAKTEIQLGEKEKGRTANATK